MPVFSSLCHKILIFSLMLAIALPMRAQADETDTAFAQIFEGAQKSYSHLNETAGNTVSNAGTAYPLLALNVLTIGAIYFSSIKSHNRTIPDQVKRMIQEVSREAALETELAKPGSTFVRDRTALMAEREALQKELGTAQSATKIDKAAIKRLTENLQKTATKLRDLESSLDELGRIAKERAAVFEVFRTKLADGNRALIQEFAGRMPPEQQTLFWNQMKAKGVRYTYQIKDGATTMAEMTEALSRAHELDVLEHQVITRAIPRAEVRFNLKTPIRLPVHPNVIMETASNNALKLANPSLVARERALMEADMLRLVKGATKDADLATKGLPWFKWRIPLVTRYEPTKFGNWTRYVWRKSWPVILIGGAVTANAFYLRAQYDAKQAELEGERLDSALKQRQNNELLKQLFLYEGAGTLMVQFQWRQMQEKYGQRGFTFDCPVSADDELDNIILKSAFESAMQVFLQNEESPIEGKRFRPEFYRELWSSIFRLAEAKQPDLKTLPRNVAQNPELLSLEQLIQEFAAGSEIALYEAGRQLNEYSSLLDVLKDLKPKDREPVLKGIKNGSVRQVLEMRLATLDRYKKEAEKDQEDPDPEKE